MQPRPVRRPDSSGESSSSSFEVVLRSPRLRLRPWRLDDAEAFHAIWGDPEVIWWGASESLEQSREGLEALLTRHPTWPNGVGWFAVTPRDDDEILGDVLTQPAKFVDGIEIGWHFKRSAWGRGYATEAASCVLAYAHDFLRIDPVYAIVATQNDRSLRVVQKLSMQRLRTLEYSGLSHILFSSNR